MLLFATKGENQKSCVHAAVGIESGPGLRSTVQLGKNLLFNGKSKATIC